MEILKLDANANAGTMVGTTLRKKLDYTAEMRRYCAVYVVPEERDEFLCAMNRKHIQGEAFPFGSLFFPLSEQFWLSVTLTSSLRRKSSVRKISS